jgi:hypothetical protein
MRYEIINIETASKLASIDKTIKYINEILKEAYSTYNLKGEYVDQLLTIEKMLMGEGNEQERNFRIIQPN